MTIRIRRGRRHIYCTTCGKDTSTRHPDTTLCAECRRHWNHSPRPINVGAMPKSHLDAWLKGAAK